MPLIQTAYKTMLACDPRFGVDFGMGMESAFRALFYCSTFNLVKLEESHRMVPAIWRLATHKIQYVHVHFAFAYFTLCSVILAKKPECPKNENFLEQFDDFCKNFDPMRHEYKDMKRMIAEEVCLKGGKECSCFVMSGIDVNEAVRERANAIVLRGIVSGIFYEGPPGIRTVVFKGYGVYVRTLQVLWHLYALEFSRLARKAVGLMV